MLTLRSVTLAAAAALFAISPAFAIPPVPRPAPEFAIQLPDGSQTLLSSLRGKVVCLMFVHTTCPHCQHATQEISKLHSQYGPQGFQEMRGERVGEANVAPQARDTSAAAQLWARCEELTGINLL